MKKSTKKVASLELQERIKELILSRKLKPGDLMPTENELIELLGVSRSSLREAIKSLEALYILDIHHGIGTFVGESSLEPMVQALAFHVKLHLEQNTKYLLDILDIREILQYGFAPIALAKISNADIATLQHLTSIVEENARNNLFSSQQEYEIHLLVYRCINNPLLTQYLEAFWKIFQLLENSLPDNCYTPTDIALQYREWVDAIEERDLERMQNAILHYFQAIRQRLNIKERINEHD